MSQSTPPRKNQTSTRRRGRKRAEKDSKKAPKNARQIAPKRTQTLLSAKSLKTTVQNSRITAVRRTSNRKNGRDHTALSRSNSVSSSAQSVWCNLEAEDDRKRRHFHNFSERMRRETLKTKLENLRVCVPATEHNPKASTVDILDSAIDFVNRLKCTEEDLILKKNKTSERYRRNELKLKALLMAYSKKASVNF